LVLLKQIIKKGLNKAKLDFEKLIQKGIK